MSDNELDWIQQARMGNSEAFTNILEKYQKPVFNLCYRMLGDGNDAEDAAQETFWRAYQGLKRYNPQQSFATWLLSIAAHYCIDQYRRRKVPVTPLDLLPEDGAPDPGDGPEKIYSQTEEQKRLRKLLDILPTQDRAAVIMKYWYDFSDQEIATALSLTVSAVKSRLHRARRDMAENWMEQQKNATLSERSKYESPAF